MLCQCMNLLLVWSSGVKWVLFRLNRTMAILNAMLIGVLMIGSCSMKMTKESCEACVHAKLHGWWGPDFRGKTHCQQCHRTWAGASEAHCRMCCAHFSSNSAADRHWVRSKHVSPVQVAELSQREDGTWTQPMSLSALSALVPEARKLSPSIRTAE